MTTLGRFYDKVRVRVGISNGADSFGNDFEGMAVHWRWDSVSAHPLC